MYPTHLQYNAHLNDVVGNYAALRRDDLAQIAVRQLGIIQQELSGPKELMDGIAANDLTMIRDGLGDVIVTFDGLLHRLALSELHPGNVSSDLQVSINMIGGALNAMQGILDQLKAITAVQRPAARESQFLLYAPYQIAVYDLLFKRFYDACSILASYYRIPVMADQLAIFTSNMSKFDLTMEAALASQVKYDQLGLETHIEPVEYHGTTYFIIKSSKLQHDAKGTEYSAGKFLKSDAYREPVLDAPLVEQEFSGFLPKGALLGTSYPADAAEGLSKDASKVEFTATYRHSQQQVREFAKKLAHDVQEETCLHREIQTSRGLLRIELDANDPAPEETVHVITDAFKSRETNWMQDTPVDTNTPVSAAEQARYQIVGLVAMVNDFKDQAVAAVESKLGSDAAWQFRQAIDEVSARARLDSPYAGGAEFRDEAIRNFLTDDITLSDLLNEFTDQIEPADVAITAGVAQERAAPQLKASEPTSEDRLFHNVWTPGLN